ncbi:hypothetical protein [Angustibacter luteus]|uniref:Right handed beta helix domain-containing protein n=1 Tax=Angustibacter luteus TaxID=658456 RepID=A0ABW1JJ51_9ACTN
MAAVAVVVAMLSSIWAASGNVAFGGPTTTFADGFDRTVQHGLGSAEQGGAWQLGGSSAGTSVASGAAHLALATGAGVDAELKSVTTASTDLLSTLAIARPNTKGGGTYVTFVGRRVGRDQYSAVLRYRSDGQLALSLFGGPPVSTSNLGGVIVPGATAAAQTPLVVRLSVQGLSPTKLAAKAWPVGAPEPAAWMVSRSDNRASLQRAGSVGLSVYQSSGSPGGQDVVVSDFRSRGTGTPVPEPTATTTAPTTTTTAPKPTTSTTTAKPTTTTTAPKPTTSTTTAKPTTSTTTTATPTTTTAPAPPSGGRPGASNTGVPAGTALTVHQGDLTITTAGAVVQGLDVRGFVKISAANVTFKNSVVRGRPIAGQTAALVSSNSPGVVISDVELAQATAQPGVDGLKGYGFTARRLNIHAVNDTVQIYGSNTSLTASWLHDNLHYVSDPTWGGKGSHDDSIQVQGGSNIKLTGNALSGAYNAGLMVTQDVAATRNLTFTGNWADGGGCTVNIAEKSYGPLQGLVVNSNRFGRNTRVADCPVITPATTPMVADGNVYDDNGQPARIRRNG